MRYWRMFRHSTLLRLLIGVDGMASCEILQSGMSASGNIMRSLLDKRERCEMREAREKSDSPSAGNLDHWWHTFSYQPHHPITSLRLPKTLRQNQQPQSSSTKPGRNDLQSSLVRPAVNGIESTYFVSDPVNDRYGKRTRYHPNYPWFQELPHHPSAWLPKHNTSHYPSRVE